MQNSPDLLFIDTIMLSYRLGWLRYEAQRQAMLKVAREATDPITYMSALERYGIGRKSTLHHFVGQILAAPAHYRSMYASALGIRAKDKEVPPFLANPLVLFLMEPLLGDKLQKTFFEGYWWFVNNHQPTFHDVRRGHFIGIYATDAKDNASTLERFEEYLIRMMNHSNQRIRARYENFPIDMAMPILRRAFL
ncbi:MAG: hypothetical protein K6A32_00725 [Bacteroidales bacterium]|nr:hypothetical protein [Bacteroidales bacterium]